MRVSQLRRTVGGTTKIINVFSRTKIERRTRKISSKLIPTNFEIIYSPRFRGTPAPCLAKPPANFGTVFQSIPFRRGLRNGRLADFQFVINTRRLTRTISRPPLLRSKTLIRRRYARRYTRQFKTRRLFDVRSEVTRNC